MPLKATEVFTPGTFPVHTYVARDAAGIEQSLRFAIDTDGQVVSISGPSKSGKTVLVERVVSRDLLITITGASIDRPLDVWERVLDWMDTPQAVLSTEVSERTLGGEVTATGAVGVPMLVSGEAGLTGRIDQRNSASITSQRGRRGLEQVVAEIANSDFVVLIDDFHYMSRDVQEEVAKNLKEAVRRGIKIVTATVSHRGDDVVRANPELRGRVRSIDLSYWSFDELKEIGRVGFGKLNASINDDLLDQFARESAGSPQLMQSICLWTCFILGLRAEHEGMIPFVVNPSYHDVRNIYEQTSATADFRSLVDVLDDGPRTRGTERKMYIFRDGGSGDVYSVILKAVSADPPQLSFSFEDLKDRSEQVCKDESPSSSSIVSTCAQMAIISRRKFPKERTIDWDEQKFVFDIPEPYLMFFLRWSGRLNY